MAQFFKQKWMASTIESSLLNVRSNLAVLGSIKDFDRLCLIQKDPAATVDDSPSPTTHILNIDQRYLQPLARSWTSDSRTSSMTFIEMVLDEVQTIANIAHQSYRTQTERGVQVPKTSSMFIQSPMQVLDDLKTDLQKALAGVERLKSTTYATDRQFCVDIDSKLITRINLLMQGIKSFFTKSGSFSATYADKAKASVASASSAPSLD